MKPRYTARYGNATTLLLPPDPQSAGDRPFSVEDFGMLDAWLAEPGWPDNHMDVAMLEGYLAALCIWPIELAPGAWLPTIWGIRGWKVAAKIAAPETYNRFIALVMGMLHDIERRLASSPQARTLFLSGDAPYKSGRYFAGASWATGFMVALHEHSAGLGSSSPSARTAVEDIARYASLRSLEQSAWPAVATVLSAAVRVIITERPARGSVAPNRRNKATLHGSMATIDGKESINLGVEPVAGTVI
jgi:yecA family protein